MSLCCTILDVIAATSTLHWKHSSASKEHQRPQRLALLNDFIHQVDATANSDTGWTLIRILTVIKTLSKLPKDSFKVIDAAHLQSKHTTSLLQNIVASHPTYRSIWVSSQNYAQRFNVHMSLICLSLLNYVLMVPAPLRNADESSVASTLCLLSGAQLFTRPLVKSDVVSVPRTTRTGYDPQDNGTLDGRWRPVYERFFWLDPTLVEQDPLFFDQTSNVLSSTAFLSIGSSNTMLHPSRPLRSKFHIVWCQCLAQMSHLQGQCLVDFIVRFQHRFFFVLDTVAQSSQLGILEECLFMLRLFAKLPAFSTLLSLDDKQTILNLVLTTLKTVSHLTQLCLGRSQIEMAETFKPVSPREISGAGLLDVFGVDSVADKCVDSRMTILSGQPALVPSLFHQRVIVLVIKLIQNTLLCTCRLKWEQLGTAELDGLNLRRSVTRSANYAENNSVSSCEKNATVAGDILETIFHDVLDIGRLILQVLEDLPKLQKRIFIGICPQSNNHVILPLSFALHVESHCTAESIAQWLATHPNSATAKDPDICDHFNASYDEMHCVTSPAGCASHSTPQATDKLRDPIHSSCPPFSATRHLSQATGGGVFRHPSPLSAQRSALGATAHRGTTTSFIRSHGLFELYERVIVRSEGQDEADPVTDDCLPMCVTFPSVLRVLHYIVADSVFVGFTCFNRLTSMTQETSCVGPSGTHGHPSIFERPSVVRRLTEFLTALQTTGVDKLRSLHGIIKKMMKVISLRLGDDPKMLQRER